MYSIDTKGKNQGMLSPAKTTALALRQKKGLSRLLYLKRLSVAKKAIYCTPEIPRQTAWIDNACPPLISDAYQEYSRNKKNVGMNISVFV